MPRSRRPWSPNGRPTSASHSTRSRASRASSAASTATSKPTAPHLRPRASCAARAPPLQVTCRRSRAGVDIACSLLVLGCCCFIFLSWNAVRWRREVESTASEFPAPFPACAPAASAEHDFVWYRVYERSSPKLRGLWPRFPSQNTAIICGPMRMLTPPSGLGCRSEVSQVIGVSITSPSRHRPTPLHLVLSASQSSCPMLRLPRVSALPRSLNWQLCTVRPDPCAAPARPLSPASSLPVRPTPHLQLLLLRGSGPSPLQPPCASSALAGAPCLASVPAARTARTARTARA